MDAIQIETGFGAIWVEVENNQVVVNGQPDGELEGVADKARELAGTFECISETIVSTCRGLHARVYERPGDLKPAEFEVEFSVTLAGELGVPLIAKGMAEAMFKIRACW